MPRQILRFDEAAERPSDMPREERNAKYDSFIISYCKECGEERKLPVINMSGVDTCGLCGKEKKIFGRVAKDTLRDIVEGRLPVVIKVCDDPMVTEIMTTDPPMAGECD